MKVCRRPAQGWEGRTTEAVVAPTCPDHGGQSQQAVQEAEEIGMKEGQGSHGRCQARAGKRVLPLDPDSRPPALCKRLKWRGFAPCEPPPSGFPSSPGRRGGWVASAGQLLCEGACRRLCRAGAGC